MTTPNPYETLDVPPDATADEIKKAFRRRSSACHPDKGGDHEAMADVNKAYALLSDPARRAHFDTTGTEDTDAPLDTRATAILKLLFNDALTSDCDIVATVRAKMSQSLHEFERQIAVNEKTVRRLTKSRKRVKVKTGPNLVHMLIDQQINAANQHTAQIQGTIQEVERAREMLDDYESEPEPASQSTSTLNREEFIAAMTANGFRQWGGT